MSKQDKYVRMNEEVKNLDPKIFETFPIGKPIDEIFSDDKGLMRGTVTIIIGDPGVGKTTVTNDVLAEIKNKDPQVKILFISAEESKIDRAYSQRKSPKVGDTPTVFLSEFDDPQQALIDVFKEGWDIILIDSFKGAQDKVRLASGMNESESEMWLLNAMLDAAGGDNDKNVYTAVLCIQQVLKGKDFKGSNALKHDTTAMMEMRFDENTFDKRYAMFTKNRRCGDMVYKRVYYTMDDDGNINYQQPVDPPTKGKRKRTALPRSYKNVKFTPGERKRFAKMYDKKFGQHNKGE